MNSPFVTCRNLVKNYETPTGSLEVLKGVNLEIQSGDFVAIIGPSGAGKTTLLNMITGVDKSTGGEVVVGDRRVTDTPQPQLVKWRAQTIGIVFQFFQLLPTISVADNIVFPMDYANVHKPAQRRDYALSLLARLGIEDQAVKRPDMLSGGQQQRVAIARALANEPPLIIGDEPTANLDRMSTENVFNIFRDAAARGAAVIITTYDREIVANVPRVYELKHGVLHEVKSDRRALA
ncbi:MAG TPA: ABC transporter ATP-binding protein [Aggregatilinea sp.]|jgi:putative ABC transport system ATP-binding protein|uniref:ABC transporter ATP-binding protein n=1 Tax=Aggregatilinea sp. TaxID=2806333 RepID=UPI002C977255|nr:ABC transporter ATP-binding protein [Aggregatilinea sp.]HML20572.1 ABC transporter ATP-binding protein [Aggregatilinea sp.]